MRHLLLLTAILATLLGATIATSMAQSLDTPVTSTPEVSFQLFIPLLAFPNIAGPPPGTELLSNGSFEGGWTDLPPAPGWLINQQPNSWTLSWVEPGQFLYDSSDLAGGVPECVHKLDWQLPPDEQPGGPNALILDGEATYKIFHAISSFGAELRQTISDLPARLPVQLTVPVLLDPHGLSDPWGAESGVWINGKGSWVNLETMGNRSWYYHTVTATVPAGGQLEVLIRVKSKWQGVDFFIDDISLQPLMR